MQRTLKNLKYTLNNFRESVPAVPLIQTKRPQQADARDEHLLCAVPAHGVVQLQGGAPTLRRHTDQLKGTYTAYFFFFEW